MSWLKISSAISAFSVFQFIIFCQQPPVARTPHPPSVESEIGYLTASADIEISPEFPKIFISPQTTLPIIEDSSENYVFLVNVNSLGICCKIPKYQKFMVMMELSKDRNSIYFRGGIEAEVSPFKIYSGEEMPIIGEDANSYFISVSRLKSNVKVKMPKRTEGLVFNKESAFAKFAAVQRKNGLEYYNGAWLSSDKIRELRKSQTETELNKQKKWDTLKSMAESGVIVLKNGKIVHGSYKGGDRTSILFEAENGETQQYGIDDIGDMDYEKAVALGNLDSASQLLLKAKDLMDSSPGEAKRNLEQAQLFLRKVISPSPDIKEKAMAISADVAIMNENIERNLKKQGLVLFNYETFPSDVLNYHNGKGHILIGKKIWISPEQLCRKCSGNGEIACAKCQGFGKITKICEKCQSGRISCHLCEGRGYKPCNICNGVGEFLRTCSNCGGSGVVSGYYSYPSRSSLYLSSGTVSVPCSPWFSYPTYTNRTCSVCGGSGNLSSVCSYCGGSGNLICPKTEKCVLCNGAGFLKIMCPDCQGKGKIPCPDCKGKGFNGEAQAYPAKERSPDSGTNTGSVPRGTRSQTLSQ